MTTMKTKKIPENIEMTLTKIQNYNLKPYGKFIVKWKTKQGHLPNIIPFDELRFDSRQAMPVSDTTDVRLVLFMKQHKTDILTDGYGTFYTRAGSGFCEVSHPKLTKYMNDEAFRNLVDGGDSFSGVILNNI